jgi:hypothetical protein
MVKICKLTYGKSTMNVDHVLGKTHGISKTSFLWNRTPGVPCHVHDRWKTVVQDFACTSPEVKIFDAY